MTDLRAAAQQTLETLELGYDSAKAEADQYHAAMAGYRPQRHAQMDADVQKIAAAITALKAALAEPVLQTCNCRWDGEMQMQQCTLHEAHVDAIKEWAQRAKFAEKKLAALAESVQEPVAWQWLDTAHFRKKIPADATPAHWRPLYTAPPQRKPEPNSDYERGFVDGMSEQARRSVDKAVNAMTKCKPLAEEEIARLVTNDMVKFARAIERAHGIT